MAKLVLLVPNGTTLDVPLRRERLTLGRRPDNDVCLPNLAVSGEHAVVMTILSDSFLEDLGSTNGTLVNGKPIAKHFLRDGAGLPFQFHCHHRGRGLTDGAAVSVELDLLHASIYPEFHAQIDLITARWIVAVDTHSRVGELTEIPRPPRVIENDFLIEFFEFRIHEKKQTAARRISIMRSISAVVL